MPAADTVFGIDRNNAGRRVLEFCALGLHYGLADTVSIPDGIKINFRAGSIEIAPPLPDLDKPAADDRRISFTSRDGYCRDVTDMTDKEFIAFLEAIE